MRKTRVDIASTPTVIREASGREGTEKAGGGGLSTPHHTTEPSPPVRDPFGAFPPGSFIHSFIRTQENQRSRESAGLEKVEKQEVMAQARLQD